MALWGQFIFENPGGGVMQNLSVKNFLSDLLNVTPGLRSALENFNSALKHCLASPYNLIVAQPLICYFKV